MTSNNFSKIEPSAEITIGATIKEEQGAQTTAVQTGQHLPPDAGRLAWRYPIDVPLKMVGDEGFEPSTR